MPLSLSGVELTLLWKNLPTWPHWLWIRTSIMQVPMVGMVQFLTWWALVIMVLLMWLKCGTTRSILISTSMICLSAFMHLVPRPCGVVLGMIWRTISVLLLSYMQCLVTLSRVFPSTMLTDLWTLFLWQVLLPGALALVRIAIRTRSLVLPITSLTILLLSACMKKLAFMIPMCCSRF